jgi:hypothetical protein
MQVLAKTECTLHMPNPGSVQAITLAPGLHERQGLFFLGFPYRQAFVGDLYEERITRGLGVSEPRAELRVARDTKFEPRA